MFILATMLIAVYIVTMSAAIINMRSNQVILDEQSLKEPYDNIKRELQAFLELSLSQYTDNTSTVTFTNIRSELVNFLNTMEIYQASRSVLTSIELLSNSLYIDAKATPISNISSNTVYISSIQARFHLEMSDLSSSITLYEDFNISFTGQVEVGENVIRTLQSRGSSSKFVNADSLYVINGSTPLYPTSDLTRTGYYIFEAIPTVNNVGVLNVVLPNGVRIYS
jgi:hypothetical protein